MLTEKFYLDLEFWLLAANLLCGVIWFAYWLIKRNKGMDKNNLPFVVEYARSFFPVLLLVMVLRSFFFEPFRIPSGSMMPTLEVGDFIIVNKFAYGVRLPVYRKKILNISDPKRGEVFVFRYPDRPWQNFIKRVVGLPGDKLRWENDKLWVNDKLITATATEKYFAVNAMGRKTPTQRYTEDLTGAAHDIILPISPTPGYQGQTVVPEGKYFAMGDNRYGSSDSRAWGYVPEENLVGRAVAIWMHYSGNNEKLDISRIGTIIK